MYHLFILYTVLEYIQSGCMPHLPMHMQTSYMHIPLLSCSLHIMATHLQVPDCILSSAVDTSAGPKTALLSVLVHVLPQDHLLALLKSALHPCLGALAKVLFIAAVLPFPAASFIWTGYMKCIQLSGGSSVWEELHNCWNQS